MQASELNASRAWTRFYSEGTPAELEPITGSLSESLDDAARDYADRPAVVYFGREFSYREVRQRVLRIAQGLHELGVRSGDRVVLALPNTPEHLIAFYAIVRLGAIAVEHNPLYTPEEHARQLRDHGARVAIVWTKLAADFLELAGQGLVDTVIAADPTASLPARTRLLLRLPIAKARESRAKLTGPVPAGALRFASLERAAPLDARIPYPLVDQLAVLGYTSGTTGAPKGAKLSHRNLRAAAAAGKAWMPKFGYGTETIWGFLPMFHSFGMLLATVYPVSIGATAVLFPTFDPALCVDAAKLHRPTFIPGVPPMYDRLARTARDGALDLSGVVYSMSGAMTLGDRTVTAWEQLTGGMLCEGYGMTECSPIIAANPFSEQRKVGTIGLPFPSTNIRVVDPEQVDREVEIGEIGELLVQGPQVFSGYWNAPEATAEALLPGGWIRTGDLVTQDADGFITIVDRRKELIITGGYNVSPSEVEAVVNEVPGVAESAVVGVTRGSSGVEIVTAVVVLEEGAVFDEALARRIAREHLAEYKVPRAYFVWQELPKSLVGKILRKKVRDALSSDRSADRA